MSLAMRPTADHWCASVALVERRHVDLCRQSSAVCR
ncbi:putative leader peptide [Streptomyces coeruleorubidus]